MLVYTFRTFPQLKLLQDIFGEVFIFGQLRKDLLEIQRQILDKRPKQILGLAAASGISRFEPTAVNKLNQGALDINEPARLSLHVPSSLFPIAKLPTHSFCNWTMYRIQSFINAEKLETKLTFIHINPNEIYQLAEEYNEK